MRHIRKVHDTTQSVRERHFQLIAWQRPDMLNLPGDHALSNEAISLGEAYSCDNR